MILNWTKIALNIYGELKERLKESRKKVSIWVILVWDNQESLRYINQKRKWAEYIWINFELKKLWENTITEDLLSTIDELNKSPEINWFIVQMPLPKNVDSTKILNSISPLKDIDWFHPINQWKLVLWDDSWFIPCTPAWIVEILNRKKIKIAWKNVAVIWRSNIVWKPISSLLINRQATVTICNSKTKKLKDITLKSDIIIVAVWKPNLLKSSMIKKNTIVIDVWFSVKNWKIYWDAQTKKIHEKWWKITPVPWGVWALTVAMLMKNALKSAWVK